MKLETCVKDTFVVIGKEGSTSDGQGFIQKLWANANACFSEVQHLAKKDAQGNLVGIWGAMSDCSRSFHPWEEGFSKGLYLAGVECPEDALTPEGWTKWTVPGFEYLRVVFDHDTVFPEMIAYLKEYNMTLAGAVHDFIYPKTGTSYMYFPIRRL